MYHYHYLKFLHKLFENFYDEQCCTKERKPELNLPFQ